MNNFTSVVLYTEKCYIQCVNYFAALQICYAEVTHTQTGTPPEHSVVRKRPNGNACGVKRKNLPPDTWEYSEQAGMVERYSSIPWSLGSGHLNLTARAATEKVSCTRGIAMTQTLTAYIQKISLSVLRFQRASQVYVYYEGSRFDGVRRLAVDVDLCHVGVQ